MTSVEAGKMLIVRSENPLNGTHAVTITLKLDGRTIASALATAMTPEAAENAARREFVMSLKSRWGL